MSKKPRISKKATVGPDARVTGNAAVKGQAQVLDNARVSGVSVVGGNAVIKDRGRVAGQAEVRERAVVGDGAWVYQNALVKGDAQIEGHACVFADAVVSGDARVGGVANVGPRARVKQTDHVVVHVPDKKRAVPSEDPRKQDGPNVWTAYRTRKNKVRVMYGRTQKKVSEAPAELLKLVTWTKV